LRDHAGARPLRGGHHRRDRVAARRCRAMNAQVPDRVPAHGPLVIGMLTCLSCLAVPLPASLAMLAGGAFGAAGDGNLIEAAGAALCGAPPGDQVGFAIGRGATGQTLGRQVP
jgi:membrane protein DedA with SNARE-associated domain